MIRITNNTKLACIIAVLPWWMHVPEAQGKLATRSILATYDGVEGTAGYFTYDLAKILNSTSGQDFFAVTEFSFTSPATGINWTLAQASRLNGPAGYGPGLSGENYILDNVLAEVFMREDGYVSGLGVLPFIHVDSVRWIELSPFRDPRGTERAWREYNRAQIVASGTYRIVPEPVTGVLCALLGLASLLIRGHHRRGANHPTTIGRAADHAHGRLHEGRTDRGSAASWAGRGEAR